MTLQEIADIAQQYSMTNSKNIMETITSMKDLAEREIEGDFVECGVWKGGHVIAALLSSPTVKHYWLFDTFDGMTEPGEQDFKRGAHATTMAKYRKLGIKNWCRAELEEVQRNIAPYQQEDQHLHYVVGPVEQTLVSHPLPDKISLLRLDTDFYASTKIELETLWPRLVPGGILIIDDYKSWQGCQQACDEFFQGSVEFKSIGGSAVRVLK